MTQIVVKQNQTLMDLGLQQYGGIDFLLRVVRANGLTGVNATLLEGQVLEIPSAATVIMDNVASRLEGTEIASEPASVLGRGTGVGFGFMTDENGRINGVQIPKHKRVNIALRAEGIIQVGAIISDEARALLAVGAAATVQYFIRNLERIPHRYEVREGVRDPMGTFRVTFSSIYLLPFERKVFTFEIPSNPSFNDDDAVVIVRAVVVTTYRHDERDFVFPVTQSEVVGEFSGFTIPQGGARIPFTLLSGGEIPAGYHGETLPYITFPQTGVLGLTYTNPNPQGLEILFEPPISPFLNIHPDGGAVSSALKNQLDVTTKNVNFNFAVVTPNNSRQEFSEQFRVEPYAVPSIPDITFSLREPKRGDVEITYNFPQGFSNNYILAVTGQIRPILDDGTAPTDLSIARVIDFIFSYDGGLRAGINNPLAENGNLSFYDEDLKIVRLARGATSEIFDGSGDGIFYTRVQETQTSSQSHLHTIYMGFDEDFGGIGYQNQCLRSAQIIYRINTLFPALNIVNFSAALSVYNRMKYGDFSNSLFPYHPLLATDIFGANSPSLRINNFDPAPPINNIALRI